MYVSHTTCQPSMSVTHRVIYRGVSVTTGLSRSPSHTVQYRSMPLVSVTHCVIYRCVSVTHCVISQCVHHTPRDIMVSLTHRLSAIDVGHTPRDFSRCVGHNWVISRYGCVRHTARYRSPSHTACLPSMSVTHRVIYRGVSVTTGLSHGVRHTLPVCHRCRSHTT